MIKKKEDAAKMYRAKDVKVGKADESRIRGAYLLNETNRRDERTFCFWHCNCDDHCYCQGHVPCSCDDHPGCANDEPYDCTSYND